MPEHAGSEQSYATTINAANILPPPGKRSYYFFSGSLTTPPCTEGVNWNVLNTAIEVSKSQLDAFKKYYTSNNRPVQAINRRKVANY